jgi:hypothetical protein
LLPVPVTPAGVGASAGLFRRSDQGANLKPATAAGLSPGRYYFSRPTDRQPAA